MFLASYDSSGNFRFVKAFGGPHHDRGKGTGTDKYGNVYFSGDYWDNIGFDTFNIAGIDLYDGFIVRFGNLPFCGLEINNSVVINTTCFGCNDGSIGINVTGGTPPYSYHWSDGAITEDRNNLSEGLYNVCITDVNNCVFCESYNVIDQPLSTGDLGSCTSFRVFPNPVQTESIIQIDNPSLIGKLKIELFNYLNVKIKTIPVFSNNALLSASEFSNGIYFIQIKNRESDEVLNVIPVVIQK